MPRIKFVHALAAMAILTGAIFVGAAAYQFFRAVMSVEDERTEIYQIVYEIDLSTSLQELAKNKDESFETIMREVGKEAAAPGVDFFEILQKKFAAAEGRLNRYFGSPTQTDAQIIDELRTKTADALDHNIEILQRRLDHFGVRKSSITKQDRYRIVLEIAGITDIDRAMQILGKTARLEFKLFQKPEVFRATLLRIDSLLKREVVLKSKLTTKEKRTGAGGAVSQKREISVSELFDNPSRLTTMVPGVTVDSVRVDEAFFAAYPFLALLRNVDNEVVAPDSNVRVVEQILNSSGVRKITPANAEFAWSLKPLRVAEEEYYSFYLLKKEAELTGAFLTEARAAKDVGLKRGEWVVDIEFNDEGRKIFSDLTGANINKRLAIVFDKKVVIAPNIKEKIPSGSARIEGNLSADEAKDMAILLRAGSLRAPMKVIEIQRVK